MKAVILRANPTPGDTDWDFRIDEHLLKGWHETRRIKHIAFSSEAIILENTELLSNRILQHDDPSQFVLASFSGLRFHDSKVQDAADYIKRFFEKGLFLNGVQYRFYHHSNSQLVRSSQFSL